MKLDANAKKKYEEFISMLRNLRMNRLISGSIFLSISVFIELTGLYFRNIQEARLLFLPHFMASYNSKLLTGGPKALAMALRASTAAIVAVLGSTGRRVGPTASAVGP